MVNQSALVISWNKLTRSYYKGAGVSLVDGNTLYLYIIPYKPSASVTAYRVLKTGTNPDNLDKDLKMLIDYWKKSNYIFNPMYCNLQEGSKGRLNMAYEVLAGRIDYYEEFSLDNSLEVNKNDLEDLYGGNYG